MANKQGSPEKVQHIVDRLLSLIANEELLETFDPCTLISINLNFVRGQKSIGRHGKGKLTRRPIGKSLIVDRDPLTKNDWEKILSVDEFSTEPKRRSDRKYRAVMLEFKEEGCVQGHLIQYQHEINDILAYNELCYRMVWGGKDDQVFRLFRIY